MLTPSYATLTQAEAAVAAEVTALTTGQLKTPEAIQAAWIVVGYGLSLASPIGANALAMSPKAAPNFNWGLLVQTLLPVLLQIISGLGSSGGSTTTGS